jgi:hypothetical protein
MAAGFSAVLDGGKVFGRAPAVHGHATSTIRDEKEPVAPA